MREIVSVLRGDSWNNNNRNYRSANRNRNNPNNRNNNNGFRVSAGFSNPCVCSNAWSLRTPRQCIAKDTAPILLSQEGE